MLLFNEILERGFNGHEFINGLASHFRNLLMCKDASTVELLEVSDKIQQKYLEQGQRCAPLNLLKGLRMMNECDVQYKSSKNQRLTVELALMKMCALHKAPEGAAPAAPQKKKSLAEPPVRKESPIVDAPTVEELQAVAEESSPTPEATESKQETPTESTETEPVAVENPQPQIEETPQVSNTVSLKGRKRRKGAGIRISEAHLPKEEEEVDINSLPKDEFTEEQMQNIWNERVNVLFKTSPSMLSSLTKHPPKLKEDLTIELELDGAHQLEQLQESKTVLIDAIRKDLNNFSVQLETPVKEVVTKKKAYTPKEIYHQLAQENPHLETLRKEFGLDLDI